MSSGTRAGSAAIARRAKEEIVRVLFGRQTKAVGGEAHSYSKLRAAYLGKVQEIHPDKHKYNQSTLSAESAKQQFNELQEAWNAYEKIVKATVSQSGNKDGEKIFEADFTMFGVGCSFSDNEREKALRDEITDQACRGWFSSGALSAASTSDNSSGTNPKMQVDVPIVDDDLFVSVDDNDNDATNEYVDSSKSVQHAKTSTRHLIPNLKIQNR